MDLEAKAEEVDYWLRSGYGVEPHVMGALLVAMAKRIDLLSVNTLITPGVKATTMPDAK